MSATDLETEDTGAAPGAEVHEALTIDRVVHEPARLAILAVLSGAMRSTSPSCRRRPD